MKTIAMLAITGSVLAIATPAAASDRSKWAGVYDDSNHHYLDYKTDISEAKRELRSDLRHAKDQSSRIDAWAEYRREVADARHDFAKEMAERGVDVTRRRSVEVIE